MIEIQALADLPRGSGYRHCERMMTGDRQVKSDIRRKGKPSDGIGRYSYTLSL